MKAVGGYRSNNQEILKAVGVFDVHVYNMRPLPLDSIPRLHLGLLSQHSGQYRTHPKAI